MKVEVMSIIKAEKCALNNNNETSIVISITNCGDLPASIIPNKVSKVVDVLHLEFNDTDKYDKISGAMEREDAELIVKFLDKHVVSGRLDVDKLIVHCTAGQSRSAGVAAAILKAYTNDDSQIFNNSRYTPNMLCYRTVLNELMYRE